VDDTDLDHWHDILNFLYDHEGEMQKFIIQWANQVTTDILQAEMSHLASKETGVHFLAKTTTESKLQRLAEPKAWAVFFPRVRILKLFLGRIVFSTLLHLQTRILAYSGPKHLRQGHSQSLVSKVSHSDL